jgi:hypothetical protein
MIMSREPRTDQDVIREAELIVVQALAQLLGLPRFLPCPFPGLPGATIERGPSKGLCSYAAERMDSIHGIYWRCTLHGAIPTPQETRP